MPPIALFLIGLVLAAVGGEFFVRGAVSLATVWRVPKALIGATVAAFATSSPELSVSVNAALAGRPEIALGDALGANVVNLAVVLGLTLCIGPMAREPGDPKRHFAFALAVPAAIGGFLLDGHLARWECLVLVAGFLVWLGLTVKEGQSARRATEKPETPPSLMPALLFSLVGLAILVFAGNFIVDGAKGLGKTLGMDDFLVGATLVAIGTTAPEMATAVISKLRGHDEVGLGTVLGSVIFNGLLVIGVAGTVAPITVPPLEVLPGLVAAVAALALVWPRNAASLPRSRGPVLLSLYGLYIAAMFLAASHVQS